MKIALTFNGGPNMYTETVLDVLEAQEVTATLFVNAQGYFDSEYRGLTQCELLERAATLGIEIESNSYNLSNFLVMSDEVMLTDLEMLESFLIDCEITTDVQFFRPPGGLLTQAQAEKIYQEFGYVIAFWNGETDDGDLVNTEDAINNILGTMHGPETEVSSIVLSHDQGIYQALSDAIDFLRAYYEGYTFVTLQECWEECDNWETGLTGRVCKDSLATHPQLDDWIN